MQLCSAFSAAVWYRQVRGAVSACPQPHTHTHTLNTKAYLILHRVPRTHSMNHMRRNQVKTRRDHSLTRVARVRPQALGQQLGPGALEDRAGDAGAVVESLVGRVHDSVDFEVTKTSLIKHQLAYRVFLFVFEGVEWGGEIVNARRSGLTREASARTVKRLVKRKTTFLVFMLFLSLFVLFVRRAGIRRFRA